MGKAPSLVEVDNEFAFSKGDTLILDNGESLRFIGIDLDGRPRFVSKGKL